MLDAVLSPCNVACGSGMTATEFARPSYWNSTFGFDFDQLISPQSTRHSAPVCEILSCRFARSWILWVQ